jgi:Nif-specific regulatory protein
MFEASELVNSLEDYNGVTHKLLLFALEQTGAERAALLLATDGSSDLRVEAKVDCDKISLKDILDMSRNVMNSVFRNSAPLIVSDAQTNELTREYRSVIKHNIFSIACVPLLTGGKVVGVLYLDHHSLPSVFSQEERRFVEAIANFIGAVLVRARMIDVAQRRTHELTTISAARGFGDSFVTRNPNLIRMIERVPQVADSRATILLRGESGTGKEVMASIIHQRSPYHGGPFVALNCAGMIGDVLESSLFGIDAHVATGVAKREGRIQMADGGTLFLDEIGDLPMTMQAKLLRVLETREVETFGGSRTRKVDFRLVAATHRDLAQMVEQGLFREDFLYRINTIEIVLPPLRERTEDIEPLILHFSETFAPGRKFNFTREAWRLMTDYKWPGNVRELRNLVERLSIQATTDHVDEEMLPPEIRKSLPSKRSIPLRDYTEQAEKALLLKVLVECNWNQSAAARKLDLPFTTLQRRVRRHKIKIPRKGL